MRFTTEDEPDLTLPEDSIHRARVLSIDPKTIEWTDKQGVQQERQLIEWRWEVIQTDLGPQYLGRKVRGECNAKMTNRPGNRMREWSEALLNRDIPVGMAVDTDDLLGLEAKIVIGHRKDRNDPSRVFEYVSEVIPAGPREYSNGGAQYDEPPF